MTNNLTQPDGAKTIKTILDVYASAPKAHLGYLDSLQARAALQAIIVQAVDQVDWKGHDRRISPTYYFSLIERQLCFALVTHLV